jgi:hypothetical protein
MEAVMKSASNMKKTESRKALALPKEFAAVNQRFATLGDAVDQMLSTFQRSVSTASSLDDVRREALKTHLELQGLREEYDNTLGLDMVEPSEHPALEAVTEIRNQLGELYFTYKMRYEAVRDTIKAVKAKVSPAIIEDLVNLQNLIKQEGVTIQEMINSVPELGMTKAEWDSLDNDQRRGLRKPGRSKAPIEAMLLRTERHLLDLVAQANMLSKGEIRTVEQAIKDTELSRRGRPEVSQVGKMDRKLVNLKKKLELTAKTPSKMQDLKIARLMAQIEDVQLEIEAHDKALTGVELHKRDLEKLRAKHRDLAVAEVTSTGQEQSTLLLGIMRNETEQLKVIDKIRELEPDARITVTHKVNPAQTMDRIKRLRTNGRLKDKELEEVDRMEKELTDYKFSRNRY